MAEAEEQKKKDQQLLQMTEGQSMGLNIFAFLLQLFFNFKNDDFDSKLDSNFADNFAQALGVDSEYISQTIEDVQSGETTVFEAVVETTAKVDWQTVDFTKITDSLPPQKPISNITDIEIGERQEIVADTIPKAAEATGIDPDFLKGLWGIESSFGQDLVSPTGCEGDWQFSQGSWNWMMDAHGAEIAQLIEADFPEKAQEIRDNLSQIDGSNSRRGPLDHMQYDPVVSTYAAAFLNKTNADTMGIDPSQSENWGLLYSAYNIGAGDSAELLAMQEAGDMSNAMRAIGQNAKNNPLFFSGGATANEALGRYQSSIETRLEDFNTHLGHLADTNPTIAIAAAPSQLPLADAFSVEAVNDETVESVAIAYTGPPLVYSPEVLEEMSNEQPTMTGTWEHVSLLTTFTPIVDQPSQDDTSALLAQNQADMGTYSPAGLGVLRPEFLPNAPSEDAQNDSNGGLMASVMPAAFGGNPSS